MGLLLYGATTMDRIIRILGNLLAWALYPVMAIIARISGSK